MSGFFLQLTSALKEKLGEPDETCPADWLSRKRAAWNLTRTREDGTRYRVYVGVVESASGVVWATAYRMASNRSAETGRLQLSENPRYSASGIFSRGTTKPAAVSVQTALEVCCACAAPESQPLPGDWEEPI